ncbi:MAG: tetratricopeptide repeat protein, partial [Planctomycetota bacterium]
LALLQAGDTSGANQRGIRAIGQLKALDSKDDTEDERRCLMASANALRAVTQSQSREFEHCEALLSEARTGLPDREIESKPLLRQRTMNLIAFCDGLASFERGRRPGATGFMSRAERVLDSVEILDDPERPYMTVYFQLARAAVHHKRHRLDLANTEFRSARRHLESQPRDEIAILLRAIVHKDHGLTLLRTDRAEEAITGYQEGLTLLDEVSDERFARAVQYVRAITLNNLADAYFHTGRFAKANVARAKVIEPLQRYLDDGFSVNARDNLRLAFARSAIEKLMMGDSPSAYRELGHLGGSAWIPGYDFAQLSPAEKYCLMAMELTNPAKQPSAEQIAVLIDEISNSRNRKRHPIQTQVLSKTLEILRPLSPDRIDAMIVD